MMLMDDPWRMWKQASLLITWRLAKPADVRVIVDDDTTIPCTCTLKGFTPGEALTVWTVTPDEPLPLRRVEQIEVIVGDMPDCCAGIELDPVTRGFRCTACSAVTHNPNDAVEGYCGRCHAFTGVGA